MQAATFNSFPGGGSRKGFVLVTFGKNNNSTLFSLKIQSQFFDINKCFNSII